MLRVTFGYWIPTAGPAVSYTNPTLLVSTTNTVCSFPARSTAP